MNLIKQGKIVLNGTRTELTPQEMLCKLYHGVNSRLYYSKLKEILGNENW